MTYVMIMFTFSPSGHPIQRTSIRLKYYNLLENGLRSNETENVWLKFCSPSVLGKHCLFLGEHDYDFGDLPGIVFDHICKQYLVEA